MKYFIDTEFIEGFHKPLFGKRRHFIDLISIGIVAEDGRTYYAISSEFNPKDADDWVKTNVISKLPSKHAGFYDSPSVKAGSLLWKSNEQIRKDILRFCFDIEGFYGYYSDYDWVVFCSLFGRMINLPKGFPMYCRDLKQTLDEKALEYVTNNLKKPIVSSDWHKDYCINELKMHPQYPKQTDEHNALADAKWNYELYKFITK
jgi:hypothetical protein